MAEEKKYLAIFEGNQIRRHWDDKSEKWYFSVVDVVAVLSQSDRPRKYWDDLKRKLKEEGSEVSEKIGQLKMIAEDGKFRETDAADTEVMLRIVQSIESVVNFLVHRKLRHGCTFNAIITPVLYYLIINLVLT